jgi:hypothetical protein
MLEGEWKEGRDRGYLDRGKRGRNGENGEGNHSKY